MANYLDYFELNPNFSKKTFSRKYGYVKYNFGSFLRKKRRSDIKILEIGPGRGEAIKYFNDLGILNADVIDNDAEVLKHIESNFKIGKCILGVNLLAIEEKLNRYDFILATHILEHIPISEQKEFLQILFSHLNQDGIILITVPNMANPFTLFERYGDITHVTGFTDLSLKQLVKYAEISTHQIEIRKFRIPPDNLTNVIRILIQSFFHAILLLMYMMNGGSYSKNLTPGITLAIYGKSR